MLVIEQTRTTRLLAAKCNDQVPLHGQLYPSRAAHQVLNKADQIKEEWLYPSMVSHLVPDYEDQTSQGGLYSSMASHQMPPEEEALTNPCVTEKAAQIVQTPFTSEVVTNSRDCMLDAEAMYAGFGGC